LQLSLSGADCNNDKLVNIQSNISWKYRRIK
jgi:hypothetical protein